MASASAKKTETLEVAVQTNDIVDNGEPAKPNDDDDDIDYVIEITKHCHRCYEREPDFVYPRCGHLNSCYICINEEIAQDLIPRCRECNKALWNLHYVGPTIMKQV